ncbi:RAC-gamma serine/threonine-protein kinase [Thelohanellus kitauei]|uniref:RAC-gamma serine/threonine-protein kinase n=1 Tax=Thelohanellus kitauei TaxID=669202 RepID=A0A0C2N9N0_THEKT|nr:RAC-gamma serine/threonine-protein kinase [Thelohanellus kitauei]
MSDTIGSVIQALKVCEKNKRIPSLKGINETAILSTLKHPFIVKMIHWFQNENKYFIIMEYLPGGNLNFHLKRNKKFSEHRAKIYAAEITLALTYLHKRNIIYRDLKSENIMIDIEGHVKLVDFGLSRQGVSYTKRCLSFCGTLAYISPEMANRQEYWYAVDWWSLGVMMFEILNGRLPFAADNDNEVMKNILEKDVQFITVLSCDAKSFISDLLIKNPEKRLGGSTYGCEEVKNHPYFFDIDFEIVYNKKITPPFVPMLSDISDTKYFQNQSEPDEYLTNTHFTDFLM